MHDVRERLRRELARIQPSPGGLEKTLRLVQRRERNRRAGAAVVGLLLLPGLALGLWLALGRWPQPPAPPSAATSGPVARPGEPHLFLAGAGELWVVDVAGASVRHRRFPQLSPGDPPYRIVRRGDKLVLWSYQTLTLDPSSNAAGPSTLVPDSWIFIPSAAPDRIWVGILDPKSPETERRLKAVREVTVDGRVTVGDVRPPQGRWPLAATSSALAFQSHGSGPGGDDELELWNPRTGKVMRRLPGEFPVASHGDLLAWCRQSCARLHLTNVATGKEIQVRPPAGVSGFAPYQGVFSPDGKLIAVPVRSGSAPTTQDPKWRLALVDVEEGTATLVQGPTLQGYVFVDWSPAGTTVFITGGDRFKERTIFEYRLGTAGARRLPVEVGDFYGMAAA
jgi:WD40 repeat protein